MLVLSRKVGEKIQIGKDVVITILEKTPHLKIGIDAPREIAVVRSELLRREQKDQAA